MGTDVVILAAFAFVGIVAVVAVVAILIDNGDGYIAPKREPDEDMSLKIARTKWGKDMRDGSEL